MNGEQPEVYIDDVPLSLLMPWGDLEWVTVWPGGTESITFDVARHDYRFRAGAEVVVGLGGIPLASGPMLRPTRGEPLTAEGHFRSGEDYTAFDTDLEPTLNPDLAADVAIARGLRWKRATTFGLAAALLDPEQPHTIAQVHDQAARQLGQQWGILPDRRIHREAAQPPTLHIRGLGIEGLGVDLTGYASVLQARYNDSTTGTYRTAWREDRKATARWGRVERTIPDLLGEGVPMTHGQAQTLLQGILAAGVAEIGWTKPIEVQQGDVVTAGAKDVHIHRIHARQAALVHDLQHDIADLKGGTTATLRIARTRHQPAAVLIEPVGLASPEDGFSAALSA